MRYSNKLRALFPDIILNPEDLLLLEAFQVKYLPDRVPAKEFAILIRAYPVVHRFLVAKSPSIASFIEKILKENEMVENQNILEEYCQEALWEIADQIIYNKHPEMFDSQVSFPWKINDINAITSLDGKLVADIGAGSGKMAFLLAPFVQTVYAVEPLNSFRSFMKEKAVRNKISNLYVMDGTLDSLPLPDQILDVLITSNAIGWNLMEELKELERVVKPGGYAVHLLRSDEKQENPFHDILVSSSWNYTCLQSDVEKGMQIRYIKKIT